MLSRSVAFLLATVEELACAVTADTVVDTAAAAAAAEATLAVSRRNELCAADAAKLGAINAHEPKVCCGTMWFCERNMLVAFIVPP